MSRSVYPTPNGWNDKDDNKSRAAGTFNTQQEAIDSAREHLRNQGGGELNIHGRDGRIRAKDTVPFGNDDFPPKG